LGGRTAAKKMGAGTYWWTLVRNDVVLHEGTKFLSVCVPNCFSKVDIWWDLGIIGSPQTHGFASFFSTKKHFVCSIPHYQTKTKYHMRGHPSHQYSITYKHCWLIRLIIH
jgi:hypothetical protein